MTSSIYDALTSCTRFRDSVNGAGRRDNSTQTDLSPLLEKRDENDPQKKQSSLETALQLVQRAVAADKSRRYEDALQLYQHALVYFLESINYETESEKVKEKILSKCKQYLDRAEKISEYLNSSADQRRGRKPSYMGSKPNLSQSTGDVSRTGSTDSGAGSGSGSPNQARKSEKSTSHSAQAGSFQGAAAPFPIASQASRDSIKDFTNFGTGPGPGINRPAVNSLNFGAQIEKLTISDKLPIDKQPHGPLGKIYASLAHTGSNHSVRGKSDI